MTINVSDLRKVHELDYSLSKEGWKNVSLCKYATGWGANQEKVHQGCCRKSLSKCCSPQNVESCGNDT